MAITVRELFPPIPQREEKAYGLVPSELTQKRILSSWREHRTSCEHCNLLSLEYQSKAENHQTFDKVWKKQRLKKLTWKETEFSGEENNKIHY